MATLRKFLTIVSGQRELIQDGDNEYLDPRVAPELEEFTNDNAGSVVAGTPVFVKSNGNIDKAQADAAGTVEFIGLVFDSSISSAASGHVQVDGVVEATTGEWDAVAGTTGGLTEGARYYLSASTAGELTETAPTSTGEYVKAVGVALSTTLLRLEDHSSVLL